MTAESNLSPDHLGPQFGEQLGLFPDSKKPNSPTRRLEHAEMRPDQFRDMPGAYYHGTYHPTMPTNENGLTDPFSSAGVHMGSKRAAQERLLSLGPRDESVRRRHTRVGHEYTPMPEDAPGDVHARRVVGGFRNTPARPSADRGGAWLGEPELEKSQYYRNRFEAKGDVSIRAARDEDITSHSQAIEKAIAAGGRVHPMNRALMDQGGKHLDVPEKFTVTDKAHRDYKRANPKAGY